MRQFEFDEFDNVEGEEEHNGRVVQVVRETNGSKGHVQNVLTMIVEKNFTQVLLVELRAFAHSEKAED